MGKQGRPKTATNADLQIVVRTIGKICKLNERILEELLDLKKENEELKSTSNENKSYRNALLSQPTTSNTISNSQPATLTILSSSSSKSYTDSNDNTNLSNRIDAIEQEALRDYLKLEGPACDQIIPTSPLSSTDQPTIQDRGGIDKLNLRDRTITILNDIQPNFILPEDIESVVIAGKQKKHLKIKTTSSSKKIDIIKLFKQKKPTDIYAQEYLTKHRAELLYKLRTLKKSHPSKISSIYSFNGNICARLVSASNKIHYINNKASYDNFKTSIIDHV